MPDLLPPGNLPAPTPSDDPRTFPTFFASDMWPVLWPKLVYTYPNAAARDTELAGLAPSARAFAFLEDSRTLWRWAGTAWALAVPWAQTGTRSLNAIPGGGSSNQAISIPLEFPSNGYSVYVEPPSTALNWTATNKLTTGFTIALNNWQSGASAAGTLRWTATLIP